MEINDNNDISMCIYSYMHVPETSDMGQPAHFQATSGKCRLD